MLCPLAPSGGKNTCLLSVVCDRRQDGAKGLEAHGNVQQVGSEEEVVEMSKNGHNAVPDQIQEVLQGKKSSILINYDNKIINHQKSSVWTFLE